MSNPFTITLQLQDGQASFTTNPSGNSVLETPAEKAPTANSHIFWVLVIGPPVIIECLILFTIYCSKKTKRNTTNWVALFQLSDLSKPQPRNQALDGLHPQEQNILEENLFDNFSFNQFINVILLSKLTKGGVSIRMENPQKEVVQVQKEDLLAKAMNRINARAQSTLTNHAGGAMGVSDGESDWEDSSDVKFNNLDVHIDEIYSRYGMSADYDCINPVYLDPTNPNRYILLTSGTMLRIHCLSFFYFLQWP
ncbi:hypothetical protein VP01_800g7 [Puccinia sorghi]|uniref:Uncharacterized protein n=1 Tax=Puccinia sorghi TaxID=27349 RepID=A0A0L6UAG9_9BASI|nr:hypothetical protein VP01_800g7 [Puccinia sorghi]